MTWLDVDALADEGGLVAHVSHLHFVLLLVFYRRETCHVIWISRLYKRCSCMRIRRRLSAVFHDLWFLELLSVFLSPHLPHVYFPFLDDVIRYIDHFLEATSSIIMHCKVMRLLASLFVLPLLDNNMSIWIKWIDIPLKLINLSPDFSQIHNNINIFKLKASKHQRLWLFSLRYGLLHFGFLDPARLFIQILISVLWLIILLNSFRRLFGIGRRLFEVINWIRDAVCWLLLERYVSGMEWLKFMFDQLIELLCLRNHRLVVIR